MPNGWLVDTAKDEEVAEDGARARRCVVASEGEGTAGFLSLTSNAIQLPISSKGNINQF